MKKVDLGQMIAILANLGVIAGIVFLGVELSQNNRLMEYNKRLSSLELLETMGGLQIQNAEVRSAVDKWISGEELSHDEEILLFLMQSKIIRKNGMAVSGASRNTRSARAHDFEQFRHVHQSGLVEFPGRPQP